MLSISNIWNWFIGTTDMPLCGVSDNLRMAADAPSRWAITHLKWFVESRPVGVGITVATYDAEVAKALAAWAAVSPLTFSQTQLRDTAHVILRTGRGQEMGFPPRSGVVANASMPTGYGFAGQVFLTLNADTVWVLKQAGRGGTTLLPVLLHEMGHNLGLWHSTRLDQAMTKGSAFDKPQDEDIARIRELYAVAPVPTPPTPTDAAFARITIGNRHYEGNLKAIN